MERQRMRLNLWLNLVYVPTLAILFILDISNVILLILTGGLNFYCKMFILLYMFCEFLFFKFFFLQRSTLSWSFISYTLICQGIKVKTILVNLSSGIISTYYFCFWGCAMLGTNMGGKPKGSDVQSSAIGSVTRVSQCHWWLSGLTSCLIFVF